MAIAIEKTQYKFLTPSYAACIAKWLHNIPERARPPHATLGWGFGSPFLRPAQMMAELFKAGLIDYGIVTGGRNKETGYEEAIVYRDRLLVDGIPRDRFFVECQSRHTQENVVLGCYILDTTLGLTSIRSVVPMTLWYHSVRAMMTLKRYMPKDTQYFPYPYVPTSALTDEEKDYWIQLELAKIDEYLGKGHLAEILELGGGFA